MNRRSFMGSILALGSAPAIARAESLMKVVGVWIPHDNYWSICRYSFGEPLYPTVIWQSEYFDTSVVTSDD